MAQWRLQRRLPRRRCDTLDGKPVAPSTKPLPRLFLLNKPFDVLVTHRDHKGRKTIFDLPAMNRRACRA